MTKEIVFISKIKNLIVFCWISVLKQSLNILLNIQFFSILSIFPFNISLIEPQSIPLKITGTGLRYRCSPWEFLTLNKVLPIVATSFLVKGWLDLSLVSKMKHRRSTRNWWKVINNLACHTSLQLYWIVIRVGNTGCIVGILAWTWNFRGGRTGITSKQQKGCLQWGFFFSFSFYIHIPTVQKLLRQL